MSLEAPDTERWSERVTVVRGLNPGPFTGPGTNTYLVGTGDRPFLIDTGSGKLGYVPLLARSLDEGGREPGEILLTHVHPDHIGGVADVLNAYGPRKVYKHPWPEKDALYDFPLERLDHGDVFTTEGATLRAIHSPGHALDHICFLLEEERAIFTGDVVLGAGTTVISQDGGDMKDYLESLQSLLELAPDRIYPGHGPAIDDATRRLGAYLEHRLERERQILRALADGPLTIPDMVRRIYTTTPVELHPAAGMSVLSHLTKLAAESLVRAPENPERDAWTLQ